MTSIHRTPINGNKSTNLTILRRALCSRLETLYDAIDGEWDTDDIATYVNNVVEKLEELKDLPWENPPQFDKLIEEFKTLEKRAESMSDDDDDDHDPEMAGKLVDMAKQMLSLDPNNEEAKNTLREYEKADVETSYTDLLIDYYVLITATFDRLATTV